MSQPNETRQHQNKVQPIKDSKEITGPVKNSPTNQQIADKFCDSKSDKLQLREDIVVVVSQVDGLDDEKEPAGEEGSRKSVARSEGSGCRDKSSESEQPYMQQKSLVRQPRTHLDLDGSEPANQEICLGQASQKQAPQAPRKASTANGNVSAPMLNNGLDYRNGGLIKFIEPAASPNVKAKESDLLKGQVRKTGGQTGTVTKSCLRAKFGLSTTLIRDGAAGRQAAATGSISRYQISNQNDDVTDALTKYVVGNNHGNAKAQNSVLQTSNYHNKYNGESSNHLGGLRKHLNGFQSKTKSNNLWKGQYNNNNKGRDAYAHKFFDANNNSNFNTQNYNAYFAQNSAVKMSHSKQFKDGGADQSRKSFGQFKFDDGFVKLLVGDASRNTIRHNKYGLSKENNQYGMNGEHKTLTLNSDQKNFRIINSSQLNQQHHRHGPNIDNLLNTHNDHQNTNNRSSKGLQMPQTSPFINLNRGKSGLPAMLYQRMQSGAQLKKNENKSNIFLDTPDQQNQRYGIASQSSLGSRENAAVDITDEKMKAADGQHMKNLIIVKQGNSNYHAMNGLNSGTLDLHKEEGGNMSKHANMKHQSNYYSMLQGDQKDAHNQEPRMKASRMMSSLSPTPINNNKPQEQIIQSFAKTTHKPAKLCQPAKVLAQYVNDNKPKRTQRLKENVQISFHCRQLLRNLFLYLKKNIVDPEKKATMPKFRYFASLASVFNLREIQIQSWGYALYSILVDEQLLPCNMGQEHMCKKAIVDYDSVEDVVLKLAVVTAIQHELEMPKKLISLLHVNLKEMRQYYLEIQDRMDDPIKLLYVWKIIERENIHRDEENALVSQNDKKSKVYDYNKTVEELASQDISKRNITYTQGAVSTKVLPKNAPGPKTNGKRRHNQTSSNDQSMACAEIEEEKERSFERTQSDKEKQPQEKGNNHGKANKRDSKVEDKSNQKLDHQKHSHAYRQQYQNTQQFQQHAQQLMKAPFQQANFLFNRNNQFSSGLLGTQMTPIGQGWGKSMMPGGFNPGVQKLPTLSGFQPTQSAFSPYDPQVKDGSFLPPGHQKNMVMSNSIIEFQPQMLPSQSHMLSSQMMPELGSQAELFSKLKPYDMQMQYSSMSGLMGRDIMGNKYQRKDSFDHTEQDQGYDRVARGDSFNLTNTLMPSKQKMQPMGLMSFNSFQR